MNPEPTGTVNGAWMPSVVFDPETNIISERLQDAVAAENIDARVFFHPLSSLSMFESQPENIIAWSIPGRAINLPSFHDMTVAQQDSVINVMANVLDGEF
jgi:perosamine synthetase